MRKLITTIAPQDAQWPASAAVTQLVMLTYFVIDNHVNLYPWNNPQSATAELPSTLWGLIPFSLYSLAFARRIRWGMLIGMVHSYVWLILQIRQWWLPYLFGPTLLHGDVTWYYEHGYTETIKILPPIANHPIPDAQHLVLQFLSLLVVVTATIAYFQTHRARTGGHEQALRSQSPGAAS